MIPDAAIRGTAAEIEAAGVEVVALLRERRVQGEDDFTVRLIDRIEARVTAHQALGITWVGTKLTDRGRNAQETRYGADLLGVLSIDTASTSLTKGFLVQAKLIRQGRALGRQKLNDQCEQMLSISPDAYVFIYHSAGIAVVSALAVARSTEYPRDLPSLSLGQFFADHFASFIGDEKLGLSMDDLDAALEDRVARHVLHLTATDHEA